VNVPKVRHKLSPLECRVLSELAIAGKAGISPTMLASWVQVSRASLYVLLRRLAGMQPPHVRREPQRVPGRNGNQVLYAITPTGQRARERFAKDVGLRT
jgi:DNA-binding MarR family transcriptional regulator